MVIPMNDPATPRYRGCKPNSGRRRRQQTAVVLAMPEPKTSASLARLSGIEEGVECMTQAAQLLSQYCTDLRRDLENQERRNA